MRLDQRFEVRQTHTPDSITAPTTAASGPCSTSSRKMKMSPAAIETLVLGGCSGNMPTTAATRPMASTWEILPGENDDNRIAENPPAVSPPATSTIQ